MPTRPSDTFWQDGTTPYLIPGLNDRENAVKDYAEALASEATAVSETASLTLALTHKGQVIEADSATTITITVPANASVAFPIGSVIEVDQLGTGTVTFAPAAGVTILSSGGLLSLRAQYSSCDLRKRATDEWVLVGDLA